MDLWAAHREAMAHEVASDVANRAVLGGNMSIIRIKVRDDIADLTAMHLVEKVIAQGLISNNNTQYCYATAFNSGLMVYCDKGKSGAHLFQVYKGK